jgi:hypothetical protein
VKALEEVHSEYDTKRDETAEEDFYRDANNLKYGQSEDISKDKLNRMVDELRKKYVLVDKCKMRRLTPLIGTQKQTNSVEREQHQKEPMLLTFLIRMQLSTRRWLEHMINTRQRLNKI